MHSHNRTLIARLGFADPDRKEPLHDAACRYLTSGDRPLRVMRVALPDIERERRAYDEHSTERGVWAAAFETSLEVAISKGAHDYKTTIGFLDAIISGKYKRVITTRHPTFG